MSFRYRNIESHKLRFLVPIFLLALATPLIADTNILKQGMSFSVARKLLLQTGWQPIRVHDQSQFFEIERKLVAANILELESCAMDMALCQFYYRNQSQCLRLQTKGEEIKDLLVANWDNECPKP